MLYGLISPARDARHRAGNGFRDGKRTQAAPYWPLFFRTWSQAVLILVRCSLRQARMVKSPWSITGRQNFCTSRLQAFCSSGVPLRCCCWAMAPDETEIDNRVSARRNLRIVFLHFAARNPVPDLHFGIAGTDLFGWAGAA